MNKCVNVCVHGALRQTGIPLGVNYPAMHAVFLGLAPDPQQP